MASLMIGSGPLVNNNFDPNRGGEYSLGAASMFNLDKPVGFGEKINDLQVQVSTNGTAIPIVYGTFRVAGNVIWASKMREGNGGYVVDFAVGLCEGPGIVVRRIWADGKLYYDTTSNNTGPTSIFRAQLMKLYDGSEEQMPDPIMEADKGAGNVSAHRGLAYMMFGGLQLVKFGNKIPNLTFEVVTPLTYLLKDIVVNISRRVSLPLIRLEANQLNDAVEGYGITTNMPGRSAIEGLMPFFMFDAVESDGKVKFVKRGRAPVIAISSADTVDIGSLS